MARAGRCKRGRSWRRILAAAATLTMVSMPGAAAASGAGAGSGTGIVWTRVEPATSPPQLVYSAMGYDPATDQVVLDGGADPQTGVDFPQTWVWDGTTWAESGDHGIIGGEAAAYDGATHQLLVFGGYYQVYFPNILSNSTWEWNGSGWTGLSPATSPPPEWGASMAYDAATRQLVLLGGAGADRQTWLWNGTTWTQAHPATTPPVQFGGSMAYDPTTGQLVLFGGSTSSAGPQSGTGSAGTWTWNGSTWTKLSPATSPPPVIYGSIAYYPPAQRLVLLDNQGDTWTWDGTTWAEAATGLGSDQYESMAYDASAKEMVLFGGVGTAAGADETLLLRPPPSTSCSRTIATTFSGPLTVTGGVCVDKGGSVNGSVTVRPGGSLTVTGGAINGPLTATGAAGVRLCGATLAGAVTLTGTAGPVTVGGSPGSDCAAVQMSGPLTVSGSAGPVTIGPATISGTVSLSDNRGGVTVTGTTIHGNLACTGNTPAPGDAGASDSVDGPATGQCAHLAR